MIAIVTALKYYYFKIGYPGEFYFLIFRTRQKLFLNRRLFIFYNIGGEINISIFLNIYKHFRKVFSMQRYKIKVGMKKI